MADVHNSFLFPDSAEDRALSPELHFIAIHFRIDHRHLQMCRIISQYNNNNDYMGQIMPASCLSALPGECGRRCVLARAAASYRYQ